MHNGDRPMDGKMLTERAFRLLTIDLDDTLWPCAPTIKRAEAVLYAWLELSLIHI